MRKTITVVYKLYDTEQYVKVPVSYEIKTEGDQEVYKCSVDARGEKMPEWLSVTNFEIPTVHTPGSPGVSVTMFSEVRGIKNVDTAFFIQQVYQSIFVKEASEAI